MLHPVSAQEVKSTAEIVNEDAVFEPITGFRNFEWGTASIDDVLEKEMNGLTIDEDFFVQEDYSKADKTAVAKYDKVLGFDCYTMFCFDEDDKLCGGIYTFNTSRFTNAEYYDNYQKIVEVYEDKYGDNETITVDWKNGKNLYENTTSGLGSAIAYGSLVLENRWNGSDGSSMRVKIERINGTVYMTVSYSSPERMKLLAGSQLVSDDNI